MILALILLIASNVNCFLNIISNDLNGTETLELELTDKQLGLQKYLSFLTILQTKNDKNNFTKFGWKGWDKDGIQ